MSDIRQRLINCFQAVFPDLSAEEIPRASTASVAAWDSLASVTLVAVVEEEFGVAVAPEEYESMVSFELVRETVEAKTANA